MNTSTRPLRTQSGLTLVELMIAMVLGLLVLLGVTNVFLAQRQAFQVIENLARVQDNARVAFELMARELREAGGTPCGTPVVTNVVNDAGSSAWLDWTDGGIEGFEASQTLPGVTTGMGVGQRVSGTDAVIVRTASLGEGVAVIQYNPSAAQFKANTTSHGVTDGDVVMICDYKKAAIMQVGEASSVNDTVVHNTGKKVSPGNSTNDLGFAQCGVAAGDPACTAALTQLTTTRWFVGNNARGGRSLFRIINGGGAQEIVEGISDMELQYLTRSGSTMSSTYEDASAIGSWANDAANLVVAVRVTLDLESLDAVGTDGSTVKRQLLHLVSLRHREIVQ